VSAAAELSGGCLPGATGEPDALSEPDAASKPAAVAEWVRVCALDDIVPNTGVCALVGTEQVAIFRLDDDSLYALGNFDPLSGANVLSRGIVGDLGGELVVASPVYKQHFSLATGRCLEDADACVPVFAVRAADGIVLVQAHGHQPASGDA
jgi:NAD(P)H-dependent nitrite reductase small subunit